MGEKTINQQLNDRLNERAKQEGGASQAMAVQLQVGCVSMIACKVGEFRVSFRWGQKGHFVLPPFKCVCFSKDEQQ